MIAQSNWVQCRSIYRVIYTYAFRTRSIGFPSYKGRFYIERFFKKNKKKKEKMTLSITCRPYPHREIYEVRRSAGDVVAHWTGVPHTHTKKTPCSIYFPLQENWFVFDRWGMPKQRGETITKSERADRHLLMARSVANLTRQQKLLRFWVLHRDSDVNVLKLIMSCAPLYQFGCSSLLTSPCAI